MKYVCNNPECEKYGVEEYLSSETYRYSGGRMVGEHALCPSCGKERKEINPNTEIPLSQKTIGMNFFDGKNIEERRDILRQRTHAHFNREIKEKKEYMINKAKSEFQELHRQ